jgi:hypothetical protein
LLPNGKAFFIGATSNTVVYTPSGSTSSGSWVIGPNIPNGQGAPDAPAAMMINGRILCAVSPAPFGPNPNQIFTSPVSFYEYDYTVGTTGSFFQVLGPTGTTNMAGSTYYCTMLALPDGNVLFSAAGSQLYVYQPAGAPIPAGKPAISSLTANANGSFHLTGTLFNGLSQGASYGDDAQMDSNYPLVRMTNNATGNVLYGRTFNWSSTGVQTGSKVVSTEFTVPSVVLQNSQAYSLVVVANGIASAPITFTPPIWVDFNYTGVQFGTYAFPYQRLTNGVNAVSPGGAIFIRTSGHSAERTRIAKALRLVSPYGTAAVGR